MFSPGFLTWTLWMLIQTSVKVASFIVPKGTLVCRCREEALKPVCLGVHIIETRWPTFESQAFPGQIMPLHAFCQNHKITERPVQLRKPVSQYLLTIEDIWLAEAAPTCSGATLHIGRTQRRVSPGPQTLESKEGPGKKIWGLRPVSSKPQKSTYKVHSSVAPANLDLGASFWEPVSGRKTQTDLCQLRWTLEHPVLLSKPCHGQDLRNLPFPHHYPLYCLLSSPCTGAENFKSLQYALSNPLPSSHQHFSLPHCLEHGTFSPMCEAGLMVFHLFVHRLGDFVLGDCLR